AEGPLPEGPGAAGSGRRQVDVGAPRDVPLHVAVLADRRAGAAHRGHPRVAVRPVRLRNRGGVAGAAARVRVLGAAVAGGEVELDAFDRTLLQGLVVGVLVGRGQVAGAGEDHRTPGVGD